MSIAKKLVQAIQSLYHQMLKLFRSITKRVMNWLLRGLMIIGRRGNFSRAGFVLPTVTMVILVVVLLTTAIVFRSFDRTKNARNYRVDETVLAAATPAIDRAKTKLNILFQDPRLPRATPSDDSLYGVLKTDDTKFNFGDEERLKLAFDIDGNGSILKEEADAVNKLEDGETVSSAWRFPVDTDGNGKFDSFTLYSILFRSPARDSDGAFNQARNPLGARTPPMDDGIASGNCAGALTTSAKLVTEGGWYKSGSKLKKSIFVYTVTVPIVKKADGTGGLQELTAGIGNFSQKPYNDPKNYEEFKGNPGFSALEYQQDRARIPLSNNAVVFQDDLAIVAGSTLRLNGSVITNGNLFTTTTKSGNVYLYQVSDDESCFYQRENSLISVGGHVINSQPLDDTTNGNDTKVDLFEQKKPPGQSSITKTNQSASSSEAPRLVLYNNAAYEKRIGSLVDKWVKLKVPDATKGYNPADPNNVITEVQNAPNDPETRKEVRAEALRAYFTDRTRRVPFDEVGYGVKETFTSSEDPQGTGDSLRPPNKWIFPYDPGDGKSAPKDKYANIDLNINGSNKLYPEATEPNTLKKGTKENYVGDRILVGNNLPAIWYNSSNVAQGEKSPQNITDINWDKDDSNPKKERGRFTQVKSLTDVGDTARDGFWEKEATKKPKTTLDTVGGLRVVTGAGVYERKYSFLPPPTYDNPATPAIEALTTFDDATTPTVTEQFPIVWPDTMPMSPGVGSQVYDNLIGSATYGQWIPLPATLPNVTAPTIEPIAGLSIGKQFAKGDLRMRATAVYHYAKDIYQEEKEGTDHEQKPIACISSYYDPTNPTTARNRTGLPDVSGQLDLPSTTQPTNGNFSNNGVSYPPPTQTSTNIAKISPIVTTGLFPGDENATTLQQQLGYQANLVFPSGRFVNENLRNALKKEHKDRTLSEQSAIESTMCALQILGEQIKPDKSVIDDGTIAEVAFLDARQVQGIDGDDLKTKEVESVAKLTGNYDLSIEERQPLEIRVTKLDLDKLRRKTISFASGITGPDPEYLLPNSGIIYATRDDALPDLSDLLPDIGATPPQTQNRIMGLGLSATDKSAALKNSAVDYKLDPTRRPNGIMLFNGEKLARANKEDFREEEKGLIVATNLPAYLWGWADSNNNGIVDKTDKSTFNPHSGEEFTATLTQPNWDNFYTRNTLNPDFACRKKDPRLPKCKAGDTWRSATVVADAMTMLSRDFRFGFRNEGDYDIRNNNSINQEFITHRLQNGFFANTYGTNGLSSSNPGAFDTRNFNDATYSGTTTPPANSGSSYVNNFVTPVQRRGNSSNPFPEYVMEICRKFPVSECTGTDWVVGIDANGNSQFNPGENQSATATVGTPVAQLLSGTTSSPALDPADQRYPRRVAFARNANNQLTMTTWPPGNLVTPIALGIDSSGKVNQFPYLNNATPTAGTNIPRLRDNALWFRGTQNSTGNPATATDIRYDFRQRWLYYLPPFTEREESLLPDIFIPSGAPTSFQTAVNALNGAVAETPDPTSLLFTENTDPSDHVVCMGASASKSYNATLSGTCTPSAAITTAITNLQKGTLTQTPTLTLPALPITLPRIPPTVFTTEVRPDNFYIYELPTPPANVTGTLTLNGDRDTIFVFQSGIGNSITFDNFTLTLNGVDPNNIFWVSGGNISFGGANQLAGNFLGTGNITLNATTTIYGGRFLGAGTFTPGGTIRAMTTQNEPLLVPVLQLNVADANNGYTSFSNAAFSSPPQNSVEDTNWQQPAAPTTFNLIFATGNTPPRTGEGDGGIGAFARLLEDWLKPKQDLTISGSMMEFNRSSYATAPNLPLYDVPGVSFYNTRAGIFNYFQYYAVDNNNGRIPQFGPPNRLFGYDVGLLSQLPDLFSSLFTTPPAGDPDEFFQEVQRNDPWVQNLLCAVEAKDSKTAAINQGQRPQNCPVL